MKSGLGFREARRRLIRALEAGACQHEARAAIDTKNLLHTGQVSVFDVIETVRRCRGQNHVSSPHHLMPEAEVHVLRRDGWCVKFYFLGDPDAAFISVHR